MQRSVSSPASISGDLSVPGDKSISHRSLILNAVARGDALVTGLSSGADVMSTMGCLQAMGVGIEAGDQAGTVTVHGTWQRAGGGLREPEGILDAGNAGTSMRLLAGLLAGQPFTSVLTGDASLRTRPMGRIVQPLKQMGAQIMAREDDTLAPLTIRGGSLKGIEYTMPVASAQLKSCIMLAGLSADGETILHQPALSRDHTERMVTAMGGTVISDGLTLVVRPTDLDAVDIAIPGDISSAAFWLVAGLCHPNSRILVRGVGLNPSRTGILDALEAMGAGDSLQMVDERTEGGEPVADLLVTSAQLTGTEIQGDLIPRILDEIPILAVAACFAEGDTVIRDARELRVKESDRIATTVGELTRLGANLEEREDGMVIHGSGGGPGTLTGAQCESHLDHRLAMALGVAGLLAQGETTIGGAEDASISYPEFWEHLDRISVK
ncbi:MAG: 3-phosphoshikimate 1-carboxyvinyltransferase [SAR202 cluster bacterium Io17-Chloro-G9]|nr:MAG: 3-phosphoshikimate 1-carboxyvinyltransferase [SAR202 cluster bacterium Io17-Chloro-G9]